jgi:hypothetical protein
LRIVGRSEAVGRRRGSATPWVSLALHRRALCGPVDGWPGREAGRPNSRGGLGGQLGKSPFRTASSNSCEATNEANFALESSVSVLGRFLRGPAAGIEKLVAFLNLVPIRLPEARSVNPQLPGSSPSRGARIQQE